MINGQINTDTEPILVLCHTFFHNAFRNFGGFTMDDFDIWKSTTFLARFIIERQSELPERQYIASTSQNVFDDFKEKFELDEPTGRRWEMVEILKNMIFICDNPSINKLEINDGIITMADVLYSRSKYSPVILVTTMPKKLDIAKEFYGLPDKNFKESDIPFQIYSPLQTEAFLKGKFPELCKIVSDRSVL
jgi:hypothetical protein